MVPSNDFSATIWFVVKTIESNRTVGSVLSSRTARVSLFPINLGFTLSVHFAFQEQSALFIKVRFRWICIAVDSMTFSRREISPQSTVGAVNAGGTKPISSRAFLDHSRHYLNWCAAIFLPGPFGRFCPVCIGVYTHTAATGFS